MLKYRIITAAVLIPLVIWAIISLSNTNFSYVLAIILFIAALEWNDFVHYKNKISGWIFTVVITSSYLYLQHVADIPIIKIIIYMALVWWLISLPLLFRYPFKSKHLLQHKSGKVVIGFIILLSTFLALNLLRNSTDFGADYVLYFLIMIWLADSGAYFAGRAWGKHKLLPTISPGKTWEGVAGAIAVTFIASLVAVNFLEIYSSHSILLILLTLVTVIYSIIGDLSESMFKRMANLKDSGHILPGHGGVLDRIDSLTSGLPVFLAGLWLIEIVV